MSEAANRWYRSGNTDPMMAGAPDRRPPESQGVDHPQARPPRQAPPGKPAENVGFPVPLKFHKKKVQIQFQLRRSKMTEGHMKAGAVYIQLAQALNEQGTKMDWENAVGMKLGTTDISKIVLGFRMGKFPIDLVHKPPTGGMSRLVIEKGQRPETYRVGLTQEKQGKKATNMVYLNTEDVYLLMQYLESSLPLIWNF